MKVYEKLTASRDYIRGITDFQPRVGLVLGSGLGNYASQMEVVAEIPYKDIEGFPVSTVEGHAGSFIFGYVGGEAKVPVVAMKGRVHYYEGYEMSDVVMPVRLMGMLGAQTVILTNAAGGINLDFTPGDLMIIRDHISAFVPSPLYGPNVNQLGTRFPDMSTIYDKELSERIKSVAKANQVSVQEGVYVQFQGPNFETPAEIKMFRTLGADAAGMSTACEAIAAKHMGLKVCGISCISNMAAGILDQPLNHEEVQETANKVAHKFETLVTEFIKTL